MRIALCLSGQPRGLPLSIDLLKKGLVEPNKITDVFFHAWHNEEDVGKSYNSAQSNQNSIVGCVKPQTKETLVEQLQPLKYIVEPQKEFPHLRSLIQEPSANQELLGSNFYSVWMANELKKQHEQEQGFVYDMVVRTRYDLFYYEQVDLMKCVQAVSEGKIVVMEEFQNHQDWKNNSDKPMVDIFAVGNSAVMDVFSGVYPNMESLNKVINPRFGENFLGWHVRNTHGIELHKAPWRFQILHRVVDLSKI